jgi:hypothetical protein
MEVQRKEKLFVQCRSAVFEFMILFKADIREK